MSVVKAFVRACELESTVELALFASANLLPMHLSMGRLVFGFLDGLLDGWPGHVLAAFFQIVIAIGSESRVYYISIQMKLSLLSGSLASLQ